MKPLDSIVAAAVILAVLGLGFVIGQRMTCVQIPFFGTNCHIDTR